MTALVIGMALLLLTPAVLTKKKLYVVVYPVETMHTDKVSYWLMAPCGEIVKKDRV